MARRLVPGLALDRFANLRRAAIPMRFAIGLADARRDVAEPVARRPAHHRRIGVDELLGAKFPQSGIGLVVHRPCDLADAFEAFEIALVGHAEQSLRSEEHTSELQSLMRISYAVFCLKKKKEKN